MKQPKPTGSGWLVELSVLIDAGLPMHQALLGVLPSVARKDRPRFDRLIQRVKEGKSLAVSLSGLGLVDSFNLAILRVGENSGTLDWVLKQMAERIGNQQIRRRKIKARLTLPLFVLGVALLISLLSRLVREETTLLNLLTTSVLFSISLLALIVILLTLKHLIQSTPGLLRLFARLELLLPIWGDFRARSAMTGFFEALHFAYRAGVPLNEAFIESTNTVNQPQVRDQLEDAAQRLALGAPFSEALFAVDYLSGYARSFALSGEQSGRLEEMLARIAARERATLEQDANSLADWLPRLFYVLICLWMASQILGGWNALL